MSSNNTFRITVNGPGINFDKEVDKSLAERTIVMLVSGIDNPPADVFIQDGGIEQVLGNGAKGAKGDPDLSVRELFAQVKPKRNPDKIAAIGYYLRNNHQKPDFSRQDIAEYFEHAAEPIPKNLSRDIKWTVKTGWIAERQGQTGQYYLTNAGIKAVDSHFSTEKTEHTRQKQSGLRKKSPVDREGSN